MIGVVGLDVSLTSTGIVRFGGKKGEETVVQSIATRSEDLLVKRWMFIIRSILDIVHDDDVVFMEDYAWHQGAASRLVTLAELGGIVKIVLWKKTGVIPMPVNIQTIKKWAQAGKKDEMRLGVYKRFKKEFKTTDEVDAYALCDFGWAVTYGLGYGRGTLKGWEKEIIERFKSKILK